MVNECRRLPALLVPRRAGRLDVLRQPELGLGPRLEELRGGALLVDGIREVAVEIGVVALDESGVDLAPRKIRPDAGDPVKGQVVHAVDAHVEFHEHVLEAVFAAEPRAVLGYLFRLLERESARGQKVQPPTLIVNVPLNNKLQALKVDAMNDTALQRARLDFEQRWNRWNVIRTVIASLVSVLLIVLLLML